MNQICISLDCTRSMHPASYTVQQEVTNLVKFLFDSITDLQISIVCHGDDNDPNVNLTTLNFSNDEKNVVEFIKKMPRYGPNGTEEEFYQVVQLHAIDNLSWQKDAEKAFIFIADSTPREESFFPKWQNVAQMFPEINIKTFAVQCLDRSFANNFYKTWTNLSNGKLIKLGQFSDLPNLLKVLFLYTESVEKAEEFVETSLNITDSFNRSLMSLFGKNIEVKVRNDGLIAVSPARFQKLHVDDRQDIRQFVYNSGAEFATGKGFYQLVKTEKIQANKEVILFDLKTGEMFTGAKVREMIGLPYGSSGNIKKTVVPDNFLIFVQSTSYNRVLDKNTEFLYEVE